MTRTPPIRRVLMLLENSTYPSDVRVRHEALALTEAGYEVHVICPADTGQPPRETLDGVHVYRYPIVRGEQGALGYLREYGFAMVATAFLSVEVFARRGFDVIHAANPPDLLFLIAAPYKLLGKKFIFDHHDISPEMYMAKTDSRGSPLIHRALRVLERLSCRIADHVIATNQSYRALDIGRNGVPGERITVVRNGPEVRELRPTEPDPVLRARSPMLIGYMGTINRQDGVDCFLRSVRHLIHDLGRRDFLAVIMGSGDAVADLKKLTGELGISDHVYFTGWIHRPDIARYLSAMDICVAPEPSNSYTDRSTVIKMMDYMAVGRPIVAFDLPEHRFTAREAALYVRGNDELEFAKAIFQLMDDPGQRRAMGAYGRRRAETELDWSYSVPHLLDAYRKVLPEERPVESPQPRQEAGSAARRR